MSDSLYPSYRYWRGCEASPREAIDAARSGTEWDSRSWQVRGMLITKHFQWFVVHTSDIERYYPTLSAAIRLCNDHRKLHGIKRRSAKRNPNAPTF